MFLWRFLWGLVGTWDISTTSVTTLKKSQNHKSQITNHKITNHKITITNFVIVICDFVILWLWFVICDFVIWLNLDHKITNNKSQNQEDSILSTLRKSSKYFCKFSSFFIFEKVRFVAVETNTIGWKPAPQTPPNNTLFRPSTCRVRGQSVSEHVSDKKSRRLSLDFSGQYP